MKASRIKLLVALTVLVGAMLIFTGCTAQQKMGVIDMNEVIKQSPKAQEYQNQLDKKGAEIQEKYKAIADENVSADEKQKRQEEALQEFVAAKQDLEEKLNNEIEAAVKEVAEGKKIDIVFYKQSVRFGGDDITQDVINKLK